jgi:hypothetical protein
MMPGSRELGSGELGSGELAGSERPGLALLHAEIVLTGAVAGLCCGDEVMTPGREARRIGHPRIEFRGWSSRGRFGMGKSKRKIKNFSLFFLLHHVNSIWVEND